MHDPALELGLHQARHAYEVTVGEDGDVLDALAHSTQWAEDAYDRLLERGVLPVHAAALILTTVNTVLLAKVMQ
jgi:hypothetical protein